MNSIVLPKAQVFRYLGLVIGVAFMIMSIRVYLNNYLTIENSIQQTQQTIIKTQSETDFIKNFQLPYLQSQLARTNLMHHQQIADKWWLIVMLNYQNTTLSNENPTTQTNDEIIHKWWVNFIRYQWKRSLQ